MSERQRHDLGGRFPWFAEIGRPLPHCFEQRRRQATTATDDGPHGHLGAVGDGRERPSIRSSRAGRSRWPPRASTTTRSLASTAADSPAAGTISASTSARCNRRTNAALPIPSSSVSMANTVESPRRNRASPIKSGQPTTQIVAASGSASTRTSGVGSASRSSASPAAHRYGSGAASTEAHSHHIGPEFGCRSTMRRQATTRPAGSKPNPRNAPAVSRTSIRWSPPEALAT